MSTKQEIENVWKDITKMDPSVRLPRKHLTSLKKIQLQSKPYSRAAMFAAMADRSAAIFRGVPVLARRQRGLDSEQSLINSLSTKFPPKETSRVQVGPKGRQARLPVREIMRRWKNRRAIVGVTDLHIRDTKVENVIDTRVLSDFNLLIRGSDRLSEQEMMTLVIASPGNVTDSHSDDPDGTNHCFVGKKLWLTWETFEGLEAGLEDLERQDVYGAAKFSMSKFLALKSARWFFVSTGDTLFLPAHLTHKVFTLDYYLGVGSFHVGLPGCLDNLARWIYYGPLWSIDDPENESKHLVDEIARVCTRIARRTDRAGQRARARWGYDFMGRSYRLWSRRTSSKVKSQVLQHSGFAELVEIAKRAS